MNKTKYKDGDIIPEVWVTQYGTTKGILYYKNVRACSDKMIDACCRYPTHYHTPDWYDNEADAQKRVDEMIKTKIKSSEKKIAKLRQMLADGADTVDCTSFQFKRA